MRAFRLNRKKDLSGISGTGIVAEGIEFGDGQVVMSWLGKYHSMEVHPSVKQLMEVHGHNGATALEWTGRICTTP